MLQCSTSECVSCGFAGGYPGMKSFYGRLGELYVFLRVPLWWLVDTNFVCILTCMETGITTFCYCGLRESSCDGGSAV